MADLIERKPLYEQAAKLEAQALDYVGRLIERDGEEPSEEWRVWSAILIERTAFKHDVFDAPSAEPERKTERWIPCSERLPKINEYVLAVFDHKNGVIDSIPLVSCYRPEVVDTTELNENGEWIVTSRKNPYATIDGWYIREITDAPDGRLFRLWNCVAWRPLPEAYDGGIEDGATDL